MPYQAHHCDSQLLIVLPDQYNITDVMNQCDVLWDSQTVRAL